LIETRNIKEYRHAYADENLNATIATQIKVLREQRDWKQEDLAKEAGMKQPMISRYENVNYSSWSINTLKKLAEAFDVYLDVRFRSFRELVDLADHFSREILQVPKFAEDPYFFETVEEAAKEDKNLSPPEEVASTAKPSLPESVMRQMMDEYLRRQAESQSRSTAENAIKTTAASAPEHSAIAEAIAPNPRKPVRTALDDALLAKAEDYQDKAAA
jgi:transcriptional regulator with XRE-family HTH domain